MNVSAISEIVRAMYLPAAREEYARAFEGFLLNDPQAAAKIRALSDDEFLDYLRSLPPVCEC